MTCLFKEFVITFLQEVSWLIKFKNGTLSIITFTWPSIDQCLVIIFLSNRYFQSVHVHKMDLFFITM